MVILALQRAARSPRRAVVVVLSIARGLLLTGRTRGRPRRRACPKGSPRFTSRTSGLSDLTLLAAGALGIALVSLADTISTASSFAARTGETVDGSREMTGIGAANIAAGLFQGFPVSTSGSRTAVAEQAGAKTQVTGLVGAAAITLILLLVPGLLRDLPQPTLAAVVIAASISWPTPRDGAALPHPTGRVLAVDRGVRSASWRLASFPGSPSPWRLSIGNVFRRAWWPYQAVLGRVSGVPGISRCHAATPARSGFRDA